jgi:hypothetical protein
MVSEGTDDVRDNIREYTKKKWTEDTPSKR